MRRRSPVDRGDSFAALADETRRSAFLALMREPMSAGKLARHLTVSPQALSRHLRVLRKAGLVAEEGLEEDARVRIYRARPIALEPVQEWLWVIGNLWDRQLESYRTYAESNRRTRRTRS